MWADIKFDLIQKCLRSEQVPSTATALANDLLETPWPNCDCDAVPRPVRRYSDDKHDAHFSFDICDFSLFRFQFIRLL